MVEWLIRLAARLLKHLGHLAVSIIVSHGQTAFSIFLYGGGNGKKGMPDYLHDSVLTASDLN